MMDLSAAREAIAGGAPAGVTGYARPPGHVWDLPALVVGDPISIEYHQAHGRRHETVIPVRVIVSRAAEQDTTAELDTLVSYGQVPAALEAVVSAEWSELVVQRCTGGYTEFVQDGAPIGLAADLELTVIFTT